METKYKSDSEIVEAVHWEGFSMSLPTSAEMPSTIGRFAGKQWKVDYDFKKETIKLDSDLGTIRMNKGDWLIRNSAGELIDVLQNRVFKSKYKKVEDVEDFAEDKSSDKYFMAKVFNASVIPDKVLTAFLVCNGIGLSSRGVGHWTVGEVTGNSIYAYVKGDTRIKYARQFDRWLKSNGIADDEYVVIRNDVF